MAKRCTQIIIGKTYIKCFFEEYHKSGQRVSWDENIKMNWKFLQMQGEEPAPFFSVDGDLLPVLKQVKTLQYWPRNEGTESRAKGLNLRTLVLTLKNGGVVKLDEVRVPGFPFGLGQLRALTNGSYEHFNELNQVEEVLQ